MRTRGGALPASGGAEVQALPFVRAEKVRTPERKELPSYVAYERRDRQATARPRAADGRGPRVRPPVRPLSPAPCDWRDSRRPAARADGLRNPLPRAPEPGVPRRGGDGIRPWRYLSARVVPVDVRRRRRAALGLPPRRAQDGVADHAHGHTAAVRGWPGGAPVRRPLEPPGQGGQRHLLPA